MAKELGFASARHWLQGKREGPVWPEEVTEWSAFHRILDQERRKPRGAPAATLKPEEMLSTFRGWMGRHNASVGAGN